jgi:vancomycin resistance protein VanW
MPSSFQKTEPPRVRSPLRMGLARLYFTARRYKDWLLTSGKYARMINSDEALPCLIASHRTPLLRRLKDVDMQLQYNKVTNLGLAGAKINGLVLRPGETFSFWKLVGKTSRRKGYLKGMVLSNGRFYAGTGGGLCQMSNLIYWITLHTPLTVTERWRHNYDVFPDSNRTQPFGCGATVVYNYIDLQIRNETDRDYQLLAWLDDEYLHAEWRSAVPTECSYEIYETDHVIKSEWWGGYTRSNILRRRIFDAEGYEVADEFVCSNRAIMMYAPVLP